METEELLRKAWQAVAKSGVPESVQETAFKEAIAFLRDTGDVGPKGSTNQSGSARPRQRRRSGASGAPPSGGGAQAVDEDSFFDQLTDESGVVETELRDILNLTDDGKVWVIPAARRLGSSVTEQARTVIALVAGARAKGLGEKPVSTAEVRDELKRKGCFDPNNFARHHLGRMRGFAAMSKDQISVNSKWIDEFVAAVNRAHGRASEEDAG